MDINSIDELNKLESQIKETQVLLKSSSANKRKISNLKKHRLIFGLLTLIFLSLFLYSYFFLKNNNTSENMSLERLLEDRNITANELDSLAIYKEVYITSLSTDTTNLTDNNTDLTSESPGLDGQKILYSVQLGAFKDFNLSSGGLMNLEEFSDAGYNKFCIGNYFTYVEALTLKDSLRKLGFNDCFLTAKSFGNKIDIREALVLSDETQYLDQ
jgi:hypothetical protein